MPKPFAWFFLLLSAIMLTAGAALEAKPSVLAFWGVFAAVCCYTLVRKRRIARPSVPVGTNH